MGRARDRAGSERNRRPTCRKSRASVTRRRESKPWPVLGLKPLPTSSLLLRPARKHTRESARDLPLTGKARSLPWRACAALAVHSESPHCGQRSRERPSGAPFTFCTRKTMVHRTRTRVYRSFCEVQAARGRCELRGLCATESHSRSSHVAVRRCGPCEHWGEFYEL